jgi:hypothetical protein
MIKAKSQGKKKTVRPQIAEASSIMRVPARQIPRRDLLQLYVQAGGRCEFDGCNHYLLEHHLTHKAGNYGQAAHIVAFHEKGPRGHILLRPQDINGVDNLMLLCPGCHHLVDENAVQYPVTALREYKRHHEERIRHVTGLGPDLKTTIVQLKAKIGDYTVAIPASQVIEAVSPRYPTDLRGFVIDLTPIDGDDDAFMQTATRTIRQKLERFYAPGMDVEQTRHVSLFALTPIPLLVYLGSQLSNKIPVDLYQRHRDTEDWVWKTTGIPVQYQIKQLSAGTDRSNVAFILSMSGTVSLDSLPAEIDESFFVYEITLLNQMPCPTFLRLRQDLENFKNTYQTCLRMIGRDHSAASVIHLFPAVPAPVAVLCGRELLPKVDPALYVYDNDKKKGGFKLAWRVNES